MSGRRRVNYKQSIKFINKCFDILKIKPFNIDGIIVNNNNDTKAKDYEIDTWCYNQNPTFKLWLSHRGYTFNRCGQIIKEVA